MPKSQFLDGEAEGIKISELAVDVSLVLRRLK